MIRRRSGPWRQERRLKIVLQQTSTDCGLACLAMLAGYFHNFDPRQRSLFERTPGIRGHSLANLRQRALALGLQSRALRLEFSELTALRLPCLLHLRDNHFVVLETLRQQRVCIVDPASGRRWVDGAELENKFSGVALELSPASVFEPPAPQPSLTVRTLWSTCSEELGTFLAVSGLALLTLALSLVGPFQLQLIVDSALGSGDEPLLLWLVLAFLCLGLFRTGLEALRGLLVLRLTALLDLRWTAVVLRLLLLRPLSFFDGRSLGDLQSRLHSLTAVRDILLSSGATVVIDGTLAVLTAVLLLYLHLPLGLLQLFLQLLFLGLKLAFQPALERASATMLKTRGRSEGELIENLRCVLTIKVLGNGSARAERYERVAAKAVAARRRFETLRLWRDTLGAGLLLLGLALQLYGAALLVIGGSLSLGALFTVLALRLQLQDRAIAATDALLSLRLLRVHLQRVSVLLPPPSELAEVPQQDTASRCPGLPALVLEQVSFRYDDQSPWLLSNCSLRIERNEWVALCGPSGRGKSTLLRIAAGLLQPASGTARTCGLSAASLRRLRPAQVGCVFADASLFAGTVAEIVSAGAAGVDEQRLRTVLAVVVLLDEIDALPMGIHSPLGEFGEAMSSGQQQRLALACALYGEPELLLLDEATSHLDETTEQRVLSALKALPVAVLFVSHRPATLRFADRLLSLEAL